MNMTSFWTTAEERIKKYDLLTHPFYIAWSKGELSKDDLKMYAMQYYKHVDAFPEYLQSLENRLPCGDLRSTIAENRKDELGAFSADRKSHSDMWLDFAEGFDAAAEQTKNVDSIPEINELVSQFRNKAERANTVEALAAFYAYESQVPRIADEKGTWLKNLYGANDKTCRYFSVHATADIEHAEVWRDLISKEISGQEEKAAQALNSMESTAKALWNVLDGIAKVTGGKYAAHC